VTTALYDFHRQNGSAEDLQAAGVQESMWDEVCSKTDFHKSQIVFVGLPSAGPALLPAHPFAYVRVFP
jgi:hypothetical protein